MDKKLIGAALIALIVGGAGGYFAGVHQGNASRQFGMRVPGSGQFGGPGGAGATGRRSGMGGFTAGEILSMDNQSVTVKAMDGSSKIVFFSTSTQVMKSASGSTADLQIGTNVMVTGATNPDGSVTATSIQVRPGLPTAPQN